MTKDIGKHLATSHDNLQLGGKQKQYSVVGLTWRTGRLVDLVPVQAEIGPLAVQVDLPK